MSGCLRKFIGFAAVGLVLSTEGAASAADDDCPPGSLSRSQDGYAFCEPTVCQGDVQCNPDEVCRPVPLCLQVGELTPDAATLRADAGKRLVATQQCAPDKSCPQTTVCSALSRCVRKAVAERMGLLTTSAAPNASAGATDSAPPKKNCGCHVVGAPATPGLELGALAALALVIARRARGARRGRSPRG